jgi:RNA polymerase-binding transcription factor DksA
MADGIDDPRARLLAERSEAQSRLDHLAREFDSIVAAADGTPPDDEHDPDGATVGFERAQVQALGASTREQIAAIDAAIARLDAGTYGRCAGCAGSIEPARLDALPTATVCLRCAPATRRRRGN